MSRKVHHAEKRIETWTRFDGSGEFLKITTRVPKGSVGVNGQRPGTFHGATNFVPNRGTTTAE